MDLLKKIFVRHEKINTKKVYEANKARLRNIKDFAKNVIDPKEFNYFDVKNPKYNDPASIFFVVKTLTDRIVYDNVFSLFAENKPSKNKPGCGNFCFEHFFNASTINEEAKEYVQVCLANKIESDEPVVLKLADTPMITSPFRAERLSEKWSVLGTDAVPWEEQSGIERPYVNLFLPLGVCFVGDNGNHSVTIGMIKATGEITVGKNTHHNIYDISALYDFMYFDGYYYRHRRDDTILSVSNSFEFGAIFEIGRIIKENNIKFMAIEVV